MYHIYIYVYFFLTATPPQKIQPTGVCIHNRSINVFAALGVGRGQYTGLLPSLFRYAEISLTGGVAAPVALSGAF